MDDKLKVWERLLRTREQVFASKNLEKSIEYLIGARNVGEGWGPYPGVPTDIHSSALAVEALHRCGDKRVPPMIADVALFLWETTESNLEKLSTTELSDMLTVLRCEANPNKQHTERLIGALKERCSAESKTWTAPPVRRLAYALLALLELGRAKDDLVVAWTNQLIRLQRPDDGSWPAATGEPGSLVTTALAITVLNRVPEAAAKDSQSKGLRYLHGHFQRDKWKMIGSDGDTFSLATILHAVSEVPQAPYAMVDEGVQELLRRMNPNGGWGGAPGESSTIECTALSIQALIVAGENTFVPARIAQAALKDAKQTMKEVSRERDQLREEFEARIRQHMGKVLEDRDRLREQNEQLKKQLSDVEIQAAMERKKAKDIMQDYVQSLEERFLFRPDVTVRWSTQNIIMNMLFPILAIASMVLVTWFLWEWPMPFRKMALTSLMIAMAVTMVWITLARLTRARVLRMEPWNVRQRSTLTTLRRTFMRMTEEWPAIVREELVYRFFSDLIDLPPDVAPRYAEDLVRRFDLPPEARYALIDWLDQLMRLSPVDRRVLFDQLRRSYLE